MNRIFVVGASGYIGRALIPKLLSEQHEVVGVARSKGDVLLDLTAPEKFNYSIIGPGDCVVFTAAISSPDTCRQFFDKAWAVNVEGTSRFISRAIANGAKVLFLSSDAVYASDPCDEYDEFSSIEPKFEYGRMKAEVEREFGGISCFKALRLSYVCSGSDKFTSYLIKCLNDGEVAEVFHPYYRNVISLTEVIDAVAWLIDNWADYSYGILNLAGEELVSRIEMADEFNNYFDGQLKYTISEPSLRYYDARPKVTRMRSAHLYDKGILRRKSFAARYWNELEGLKNG